MIGRLKGTLHGVDERVALVDVGGVGYEVELTASMLAALPPVGAPIELSTHLVQREDAQQLFGFVSTGERELFRTLIRVSGVGPRMAMGMLSGMRAAELARCVVDDDIAKLTRLPGVGRKTAQRLVLELKDRIDAMFSASGRTRDAAPAGPGRAAIAEAESALIALGYRPAEASRAIEGVHGEGSSTEELLRRALRSMADEKS